ncbi:MAG: MoaD/ThiS family protein [Candidatus Heimdallarchaeota archaeon]|nr:MAG: MoaD/ThiS family protein [Candidatus Heimdallarchaeota archaeon]
MITIRLIFFAILQLEFGETHNIVIKEPIELRQIFDFFQSKSGKKGSSFFLENEELKKGFTILIDGRNILALEGLDTSLSHDCEVSIFPLIAGGFFKLGL